MSSSPRQYNATIRELKQSIQQLREESTNMRTQHSCRENSAQAELERIMTMRERSPDIVETLGQTESMIDAIQRALTASEDGKQHPHHISETKTSNHKRSKENTSELQSLMRTS